MSRSNKTFGKTFGKIFKKFFKKNVENHDDVDDNNDFNDFSILKTPEIQFSDRNLYFKTNYQIPFVDSIYNSIKETLNNVFDHDILYDMNIDVFYPNFETHFGSKFDKQGLEYLELYHYEIFIEIIALKNKIFETFDKILFLKLGHWNNIIDLHLIDSITYVIFIISCKIILGFDYGYVSYYNSFYKNTTLHYKQFIECELLVDIFKSDLHFL